MPCQGDTDFEPLCEAHYARRVSQVYGKLCEVFADCECDRQSHILFQQECFDPSAKQHKALLGFAMSTFCHFVSLCRCVATKDKEAIKDIVHGS